MSINRITYKETVYTSNRILFILRKEGNATICDNIMDLEDTMLSEISQAQKDKYCSDLTYVWNLKCQTDRNQRVEQWSPRLGGKGDGEILFQRTHFLL